MAYVECPVCGTENFFNETAKRVCCWCDANLEHANIENLRYEKEQREAEYPKITGDHTMNILKITKENRAQYENTEIVFDGHVELEADLGWFVTKSIKAKGYIFGSAGTGIVAGTGIEAGEGIVAGTGIKAGWGIKAGTGIKAGDGIVAGEGIEAGWGIVAGEGIEAGTGIKAGFSIHAKFISVSFRIFAGLCNWRMPEEAEQQICAEVRNGIVACGKVIN